MMDTYYVEVDSADIMSIRDAVLGLRDSGVHLSAIQPRDGKTEVNWWDNREQAEETASRLAQRGFPARAKPHCAGQEEGDADDRLRNPLDPDAGTDYHGAYVRLGQALGRFTAFDPLGAGLAAGDGRCGGMIDHDHAAGQPSRT